jgi:hypothetical protein
VERSTLYSGSIGGPVGLRGGRGFTIHNPGGLPSHKPRCFIPLANGTPQAPGSRAICMRSPASINRLVGLPSGNEIGLGGVRPFGDGKKDSDFSR